MCFGEAGASVQAETPVQGAGVPAWREWIDRLLGSDPGLMRLR
jgi:hypothetical protein